MTEDNPAVAALSGVLMIPRTRFAVVLNLAISVIIALVGFGLGFWQGMQALPVILATILTFAVTFWVSNAVAVALESRSLLSQARVESSPTAASGKPSAIWVANRSLILSMGLLLILYLIVLASVPSFRTVLNLIAFLLLEVILVVAFKVSRVVTRGRSAFIGLVVLGVLVIISSFSIPGFLSGANIKAILLFSAFLGVASVGQTLVALMGGLDLSIPFVIGAANIGLLYLIGLKIPSWIALGIVILIGALIGLINGVLSFRLQGQALILTLGTGFAVGGLVQILTSIGSSYSGNVYGQVPPWLSNFAAMNGTFLGLAIPPAILFWILVAVIVIVALRKSIFGRHIYALGGNRRAAVLIGISEFKYWSLSYTLSGAFAALTGSMLLGWSGGGFIGVGDPYLFTTLAAVVIGGTSLLGGNGGYGFTVIGVLVLQVLTAFLIGIGLKYEWQQFIFGLLILPMVALYGRSPHIRAQV